MKTSKLQKLVKNHLLPVCGPFACSGRIMFMEPLGSVLRGVYFDDSSFSPSVLYAWVFVQPLYVRSEHVHFTFGHRLRNRPYGSGKNEMWNITGESDEEEVHSLVTAIQGEAVPYLQRLTTPEDLVERLESATGLHDNVFVEEAVAYSLIKTGRPLEATSKLKSLVRSVQPGDAWYDVLERAEKLLSGLSEGGDAANRLLDVWEQETTQKLRLRTKKGG